MVIGDWLRSSFKLAKSRILGRIMRLFTNLQVLNNNISTVYPEFLNRRTQYNAVFI